MKQATLLIIGIFLGLQSMAQSDSTIQRNSGDGLKTNDQMLPRWAFDLNYRYGGLAQSVEMINFAQSYQGENANQTSFFNNIPNPKMNSGISHMGSLQLGYFFGKARVVGLGIGVMWMQHSGTFTLDTVRIDYQARDNNGDVFRQKLTSKAPINEDVTTTNFVIPVMLKFKHQFRDKKLGIALDAGGLVGISNVNKYSGRAVYDYEAIYKFDAGNTAIYDDIEGRSSDAYLIERDYWQNHQTSDGSVQSYFNLKRSQGYNVALDAEAKKSGTTSYTTNPSFGYMIAPSLTYQLSYNVTFMLGAYYSSMTFKNDGNEKYRLTGKVGDYTSLTEGVQKNVVTSWGVNLGFRIFFGEKLDSDGDGVLDKDDDCKFEKGVKNLRGCPDSDGDGFKDSEDDCKYDFSKTAGGCPDMDGDGVPDEKDACKDVPGMIVGDPALNGCPRKKIIENLARQQGVQVVEKAATEDNIETYFDVLQSHMINFDFGKSEILPSNFIVLDDAAKMLEQNAKITIIVSGHTDSIGTYERNMRLSFDRANAVSEYLQKKGVAKERILTVGFGTEKPLTSNDSEENRAQNRRTEMELVIPIVPKKDATK